MNKQTNILALCRHAPYGNAIARDGLDAILAAVAMEQEVAILLLGDGVFQLLEQQESSAIEQKNFRRNLQALPLFGVEKIYLCRDSLQERGLNLASLAIAGIELELLSSDQIGPLIASHNAVLSF
jgi:tRNA 2-thiouridine synthesizing protein C